MNAVLELTDMLQAKAMPAAIKELQELQDYAKSKGFTEKLELWDVPFWSERLRESSYDFKEEDLRAYFPLPKVLPLQHKSITSFDHNIPLS